MRLLEEGLFWPCIDVASQAHRSEVPGAATTVEARAGRTSPGMSWWTRGKQRGQFLVGLSCPEARRFSSHFLSSASLAASSFSFRSSLSDRDPPAPPACR